jgi:hypothetical protein
VPSEATGKGKKLLSARVKGIIGYDSKLQSGRKGSNSKVTWLTMVAANSIT